MTMVAIPGIVGGGLIDVCDIAFVAVRGVVESTIYMRGGQTIASSADRGTVVAAINAVAPYMIAPYPALQLGVSVSLNGQNVQRMTPADSGTTTTVQMDGLGLLTLAVDIAMLSALVNAAPRCGGGGGGGGAFYESGFWNPIVTELTGQLVLSSLPFPPFFQTWSAASPPGSGDIVRCFIAVGFTAPAPLVTDPVLQFDGLPYPLDAAGPFSWVMAEFGIAYTPDLLALNEFHFEMQGQRGLMPAGAVVFEVSYARA